MPKSSSKSGMTKRQGPGLRTAPNSRSTSATPVSSHSRSVGSNRGRGRALAPAGSAIVAKSAPATIGRVVIAGRVLAPLLRLGRLAGGLARGLAHLLGRPSRRRGARGRWLSQARRIVADDLDVVGFRIAHERGGVVRGGGGAEPRV